MIWLLETTFNVVVYFARLIALGIAGLALFFLMLMIPFSGAAILGFLGFPDWFAIGVGIVIAMAVFWDMGWH